MICATNIVVTCYRTIRNTKRCHLVSSKTVCRGIRSNVDLSHDRKLCRRSLLPAVSSQHTRHWHWQSSPVFRGLCALCTRLLHVCECGAYPRALCENSTYHRGLRERRRTLYERQQKTPMYRTVFWTLWERVRVGWFWRMALKHVYYHT